MEELALPVGRQRRRERLGDVAVHVPLDVGDRRAAEDLGQDRRSGGRRPPGGPCRARAAGGSRCAAGRGSPIAQSGCASNSRLRWLTISGSIHRPKPIPSSLIRRATPSRPSGQLAAIDEPVAERGRVVVAGAEPAVVEHEQLDAEVARRRGDLDQAVGVEAEVGGLPVVDQDRPRPVTPVPARQAVAVERVERVGQAAQPVLGVGDDRLGHGEASHPGSRRQPNVDGSMPEADAGGAVRLDLDLGQEVAGVDEAEPVRLAVGFVGRRSTQREERVVLVARGAADARDGLPARDQRAIASRGARAPRRRTARPSASRRRGGPARGSSRSGDRPAPDPRCGSRAPGDQRPSVEDREAQVDLEAGRLVDQRDLERLGLGRRPRRTSTGGRRGPACRR